MLVKKWGRAAVLLLFVLALAGELPAFSSTLRTAVRQAPTGLLTVTGQVTDKDGEPLMGVVIRLKGNDSKGTTTDLDGHYTLKGIPANGELTVSFLGMATQTVKVDGRTTINIVLKEDETLLEEVVVTGYQEVKKERMMGSTASIHAQDIKNLNLVSMDQVLIGSISGVTAIASGRPGQDAQISIRGVNSLTGSTEPVWIIDGMPLQGEVPHIGEGGNVSEMLKTSGIGNISPDDIESITVLKDAAATAIYGARAANGVIVVKTKSGHEGANVYNITAHFGVTERPAARVRMMNSEEKIRFERESYIDNGYAEVGRVGSILNDVEKGVISQEDADKELARLASVNTDWYKAIYRPAFSTQLNASVSGGTEKTTHYTSFNLLRESGTEPNNEYMRIRLSNKLSYQIASKLRLENQLSGTYRTDRATASGINPLEYATYANPYEEPDKYDLSWDMRTSVLRPGLLFPKLNALDDLNKNTDSSRYTEISISPKLEWETPLEGLIFTSYAIFGLSSNNSRTATIAGTYTDYDQNWLQGVVSPELPLEDSRGSLREGTFYSSSYTWRNTLDYNQTFAKKHIVSLLAGQEISYNLTYSSSHFSPIFDDLHRTVDYPILPEGLDPKTIAQKSRSFGGTGRYETKLSSFFLNMSYSYDDRYVVGGAIRYDGSDIIGNDNQFTPLWNISGRWNLDREAFWNKEGFFNTLSLRGGFGYTGSIDKSALPFVTLSTEKSIIYDGQTIPTDYSNANPNVKWQTKRDFNVGLETGFWKRRANLSVNYYNNLTYDLLDNQRLPLSSGRSMVTKNVADVINRGVEVDFSLDLIRKSQLTWNVRANLAYNHNEIARTYHKSLEEMGAPTKENNKGFFVEGYPVNAWYGYRFAGVEPVTGHILVDTKDGPFDVELLRNQAIGIKPPTPEYLGTLNPPIVGGFSSNVYWKRWVFNVNFDYRIGNMIRSFNTFSPLGTTNRYYADYNRWRSPGDEADIPAIDTNSNAYGWYIFDKSLERGDYLRCTYMTLGYNVPGEWLEKLNVTGLRLTLTANNLFTVTSYKGIDPALMGSFGYPTSRRYNLSVNLTF